MLKDARIVANVAVRDITKAKEFYGTTLGLTQTDENPAGVTYSHGEARLFVYTSPAAGSGQATCCTFEVDDIVNAAAGLKAKGVNFEQYELPGAERQGDVYTMGPYQAAWFKDPDGNVLGLASMVSAPTESA